MRATSISWTNPDARPRTITDPSSMGFSSFFISGVLEFPALSGWMPALAPGVLVVCRIHVAAAPFVSQFEC